MALRLWTGAGLQVRHVCVEFSCLFLLPCHTSSTSMVFQWTISIMRTYFQKSEDNNKKGNFINAPKHLHGATIFEVSPAANTVTATPRPATILPCNIWVVVDTTVDINLTRRLADLHLHRSLESGLIKQALGLWMGFRGIYPKNALHIVKQEFHSYTYGNGHADTHAKHQSTNHTPGLEHVRLDTTNNSHP